jgi:transcriptional regulator with XRE-family HTH domain
MPTLDYLIEQTQLTVETLAARSGLEPKRVQAIIDGRWTPSPEEREAMAQALGVPVHEIAFGHNMNARNIRFHRFGLKEDFNAGGIGDEDDAGASA